MKLIITVITTTLCAMLSLPAFAFQTSIYGSINYARVDGFVQTPKGGSFGSTHMNRPNFKELHIKDDTFYSLGINVSAYDYFGLIEYYHFEPHGSTILSQDLITHSQLIPAGHSFNMNLEFDWYALGVGKHFRFHPRWVVSPLLLMSWVKYDYAFSSPPIESARNFNLIGANVGLEVAHYLTPQLCANFKAIIPLPLSNIRIIDLNAGLALDIPCSSHLTITPHFGIGWLQLEYEDTQPIPNYIRYRAAPYGSFSLTLTF